MKLLLLFITTFILSNNVYAQDLKVIDNNFYAEKIYDLPNLPKDKIIFLIEDFWKHQNTYATRRISQDENFICLRQQRIFKEGKKDYLSAPLWILINCYIKDSKAKITLEEFTIIPYHKNNVMKLPPHKQNRLTADMVEEADMIKLNGFVKDIYQTIERYLYPKSDGWDF